MTDQHPITPPPELVKQWYEASVCEGSITYDEYNFAKLAARWGSDKELEACCEWLKKDLDAYELVGLRAVYLDFNLYADRRPKPPSLKEQALEAQQRMWDGGVTRDDWELVRRALEQLDD